MSSVTAAARMLFTMLVMVMMFVSASLSVSHIDDAADTGGMMVSIAQGACHDAGPDESDPAAKTIPHDCCMAHCVSMKPVGYGSVMAAGLPYFMVEHVATYDALVPNQFLKGLFRPPRTLA